MAQTVNESRTDFNGTTGGTSAGRTTTTGSTFLIVVACGSGVTINTPTDSKSNTYTAMGAAISNGSSQVRGWYCSNGTGGASHTATAGLSAADYGSFYFVEITGSATSSFDSAAYASSSSGTTSPFALSSGTPAQSDYVAVSLCSTPSSGTVTYSATGYTVDQQSDGNTYWTSGFGSKVVTGGGAADSVSWTVGASAAARFIALIKAAAGGSPALTAVSATGSVGTVAPSNSKAITGNSGTSTIGNVGPQAAIALTGNSATGSAGTVGVNTTIGLTGVSGTGSVGTVIAGSGATAALTGVNGTGSSGIVGPSLSVGLTGVQGTGQTGTVSPATAGAVTGNSGTGSVGTASPATSKALAGNTGTSSVGTVTAQSTGNVTVALTGVSATASVGSLVASGGNHPIYGAAHSLWSKKRQEEWRKAPIATPKKEESVPEVPKSISKRAAQVRALQSTITPDLRIQGGRRLSDLVSSDEDEDLMLLLS